MARKKKIQSLPFSAILRRLMKERGLTFKAVAAMTEVPVSTVHDWCSSTTPQDLIAVGRLAKCLKLSLGELLLGEEPTRQNLDIQISDLFEEEDFFDDICRVSIRRLKLRK